MAYFFLNCELVLVHVVCLRNDSAYKGYLDHCLNVLSRAVEGAKSNSALWQHYLTMYALRADADSDLLSLYEQAVQHAPSYELYWKVDYNISNSL